MSECSKKESSPYGIVGNDPMKTQWSWRPCETCRARLFWAQYNIYRRWLFFQAKNTGSRHPAARGIFYSKKKKKIINFTSRRNNFAIKECKSSKLIMMK
jgi:hypothetical protein